MYVLRTGELIVYKIRTSHVSQKATANVTWNRLPQLSALSGKTAYKPTVKKNPRTCEIITQQIKDLDDVLYLEAVNLSQKHTFLRD